VTYDSLNRMISATIASNIAPVKNFTFDAIGNLTTKSDVGAYTYPGSGSSHPHAVSSISGGVISTTFTYDPNGNELTGNGRATTWTSYNKPASITQGSHTISFLDDPEHQRFQQVTAQGTTLYFDGFGAHAELVMGSSWTWNDFLTVGNVMVGVRFLNSGTATTRYFHTDHLGSISVITDQSGNVLERLSYDAWGKRRFANGADDPSGSITSQTTRGFTNQEELGVSGLVHLNGRIYDPLLGRMTSADPTVPDPLNAQSWNRYSYVGNDPLTFTDPSGFSWLSNFFHDITTFFRSIFANPIVRAIAQIAIAAVLAALGNFEFSAVVLAAAASAAIVTGLSGGKLSQIIRATIIAAVTAAAFYEVGSLTSVNGQPAAFGTAEYAENIAGHAAVGCLSAVASGGECGPGALAAGVGASVTPFALKASLIGGTAISAVAGGLASVAGGGKFLDGAVTGAFGYLFNACSHAGCWTTGDERALLDAGDYLGYYSKACEGGDLNACYFYGVASGENPGPQATLRQGLINLGYPLQAVPYLVEKLIPLDLANNYADYLPQSEDQARFPLASDIAQFHWDEFAKFGLPPSTFGGTPFGASGPMMLKGLWCPVCR
jgi:RHS repeat-associated protein